MTTVAKCRGANAPRPDHARLSAVTGTVTHRLIAALCTETRGPVPREVEPDWLWMAAGPIARDAGIGFQTRGARLVAVSHASVFAERLLPPRSWRYLGAEVADGSHRPVDGLWNSPFGIVVDELKLTSLVAKGDGPTSGQVAECVAFGERMASRRGATFAGVRLIYLSAPRRSRLIATGIDSPLPETDLWFGDAGVRLSEDGL